MSVSSTDRHFQDVLLQPTAAPAQTSIRSQVIVTQYQETSLVFPSTWVDEVLFFPRQKVLEIPFYQKPILGVIPHQGRLIALLEPLGDKATEMQSLKHQENIRAIRLSSQVGDLAGVAILIDKIVGTMNQAEVDGKPNLHLFEPEQLLIQFFQPYRWV